MDGWEHDKIIGISVNKTDNKMRGTHQSASTAAASPKAGNFDQKHGVM